MFVPIRSSAGVSRDSKPSSKEPNRVGLEALVSQDPLRRRISTSPCGSHVHASGQVSVFYPVRPSVRVFVPLQSV